MRLLGWVIAFTLTATVCLYSSAVFGGDIRVFFSPKGGCTDAILYEIDKAEKGIDAAVYAFTSRPIAQALVRAKRRGVKIRIIIDKKFCTESRFCKYKYLVKRRIPVKLVSPPPGPRGRIGLMHNKFAVIDGKVVITGSFNWTASAEKLNYENLLVIYSKKLAQIYEKEFEKLWTR